MLHVLLIIAACALFWTIIFYSIDDLHPYENKSPQSQSSPNDDYFIDDEDYLKDTDET